VPATIKKPPSVVNKRAVAASLRSVYAACREARDHLQFRTHAELLRRSEDDGGGGAPTSLGTAIRDGRLGVGPWSSATRNRLHRGP
jgi:hypothetical protein